MPPSKEQKAAKEKRWRELAQYWEEGLSWKELEARMRWDSSQLSVQMSRARKAGVSLPYRPNMGPNHERRGHGRPRGR